MTLRRIFEPASIAVVGASANPGKRGYQILRGLASAGYRGRVFAVNPRGGRILGHEVLPSVEALPAGVDLAVFCTRAELAPRLVRACGARGVGGVVVLAVGFAESGETGSVLEARLRRAARENGVRVIGPNTSGIMNLHGGVNLIGVRGVRPGRIALLVQSGNIALGLMNEIGARTREGVAICCGLGNQVDVGFGEVLEYLGKHSGTRAVIAHIEGFRDARRFLGAAARLTPHKPVVVIKSGRTAAGSEVALSHTGALAGPYDRLRAGLVQAGVTVATRTDQLVAVAHTLASQPSGPAGSGIAILSDGGGQNTLAVDALEEAGTRPAELATGTRNDLRAVLGPAAAVNNPVDVAGAADANPGVFASALRVLAADPAVGIVLVVGLFGGYGIRFSEGLTATETEAARFMAAKMRASGKGLIVHSMYASRPSPPLAALAEAGVPVIESLEVACRAVVELERRARRSVEPGWDPHAVQGSGSRRSGRSPHPVIRAARADGRVTLTEVEARALLEEAGLVFPPAQVAGSAAEAGRAARRLGCPLAVKLLSKHILHKSRAGGVALNVVGPGEAAAAFRSIVANARAHARMQGLPAEEYSVLVAPMLAPPLAELLVGGCRDPQLGPILTLGSGGAQVELLRDAAHRVLPVREHDVAAMIGELRAGALFTGKDGRTSAGMSGIMEAAAAVARCLTTWNDLSEVEVNPLFVYENRVAAADARGVLSAQPKEGQ